MLNKHCKCFISEIIRLNLIANISYLNMSGATSAKQTKNTSMQENVQTIDIAAFTRGT
jgi:hypothetical protein